MLNGNINTYNTLLYRAGLYYINTYNTLLYRAGLYSQHAMNRVQGVAHLRNQAAHGHGASVSAPAVVDERAFVVRFMGEYPS
jgi:hypothetical protein